MRIFWGAGSIQVRQAGRLFRLFDYEHVAKGGQWGTLPIFLAGSCQQFGATFTGWARIYKLLRHFGEAVTEGVDDEFQAVRNFQL